MKSNKSDAESYSGTNLFVGYFLVTYNNGIGNINPPTVDYWLGKVDQIFSDKVGLFLVYVVWYFNIFILLIVLLNFVIALIS